jgi:hypothetical protein
MPTWHEINEELQREIRQGNALPFDTVRRRYLTAIYSHTGRNTILYIARFTQRGGPDIPPDLISIVDEDMQGFMETVHGLRGKSLDLILHSPGGQLDAAESLVHYLRSKFRDIRVIVPHLAQSAATMIACAANEIVMGDHSFLGPIDPQIVIRTQAGPQSVPAQAILEQFEKAMVACESPKKLPAWLPMLSQYGPHLLVLCENASRLSRELVGEWLYQYMFKKARGSKKKADEIAAWLASHSESKTHGRHIPRSTLESKGLRILELESDQVLQDLVLSIFHAATIALSDPNVGVAKIIENHEGKAFIKLHRSMQMQVPLGLPFPFPIQPQQAPPFQPQQPRPLSPQRPPAQSPPGQNPATPPAQP